MSAFTSAPVVPMRNIMESSGTTAGLDGRSIGGFLTGLAGLGIGVAGLLVESSFLALAAGLTAILCAAVMLTPRHSSDRDAPPEPEDVDPTASSTPPTGRAASSLSEEEKDAFHANRGLLGPDYFPIAVRSRINSARRFLKPVSVVEMRIVPAGGPNGLDEETVNRTVVSVIRECDTACLLDSGRLGLVLEDTPENGAVWAVERIRRTLVQLDTGCHVWAGISCYPAHAMSADELLESAAAAYSRAQDWSQDRIEVAAGD